MAVTIVNPARFNDDGLGTRRFIRAAFFDEGYGVSTSFLAYRQGGGIVPATSAFDAIGAGTAGDPLRMSQFSGFTVPSLSLDTQTVTVGSLNLGGSYGVYWGWRQGDPTPAADCGSIVDKTSNIYGGANIFGIYFHTIGNGLVNFMLDTNQSNSGWTSITIGSYTYLRTSASYSNGGGTTTLWQWTSPSSPQPNPFGTTNGASVVVTWQ